MRARAHLPALQTGISLSGKRLWLNGVASDEITAWLVDVGGLGRSPFARLAGQRLSVVYSDRKPMNRGCTPEESCQNLSSAPSWYTGDARDRPRQYPGMHDLETVVTFPAELMLDYECRGLLGQGGMGAVYKAVQKGLGRLVAVKVLDPALGLDSSCRSRFLEEGRVAARVRHPAVVTVLDSGATPSGSCYVVYEFVEGENLASVLSRSKILPQERVLDLATPLLEGLSEIHRSGIVHRDIKPANIMVLPNARPKILDFGIARDTFSRARLTVTGQIVGTPEYLAPETIRGEPPTPATDLYSVGVLLYQLLSGQYPFVCGSVAAWLDAHLNTAPTPLATVAPHVAPQLAGIIIQLLSKDPVDRPASAAELIGRLRTVRKTPTAQGKRAPTLVLNSKPSQQPSRPRQAETHALPRRTTQRGISSLGRKAALLTALFGLIVVAVVGLAVRERNSREARVTPAASRTEISAEVSIDGLSFEPGRLKVHLESRPSFALTTHVVMLTTPVSYPVDLHGRIPLAGATLSSRRITVTVQQAASGLARQLERFPQTLELAPGFSQLKRSSQKLKGRPKQEVERFVETALSNGRVLETWKTLADHAGTMLAANIDIGTRDKLLDKIYRLEDMERRISLAGHPVPISLSKVHPPGWRAGCWTKIPDGLRFKVWNPKHPDASPVLDGIRLNTSQVIAGPNLHPPVRDRPIDDRWSLFCDLPAAPARLGRFAAIACQPVLFGTEVSLRLRINRSVSLRLDTGPCRSESITDLTLLRFHTFDPSVLRPGRNEITVEAVSYHEHPQKDERVSVMYPAVFITDQPL